MEFNASIAAVASSCEDISTNPKPRDWPVNLSLITLADATIRVPKTHQLIRPGLLNMANSIRIAVRHSSANLIVGRTIP